MSYTATSDLGYFPVMILAWQCQRKEQTVHQEALWWCSKGVATDLHEGFDLGLVASGQVSLGGENGCFQVSQSAPLFGGNRLRGQPPGHCLLLRAVDVTPLTEGIHCDQHCLSLCAPSVILRAVQVLFSVG